MSVLFTLMTRPECELCERAAEVLRLAGIEYRLQDISLDLDLLERYGTRIPVVVEPVGGAELGWPFDADGAAAFAAAASGA